MSRPTEMQILDRVVELYVVFRRDGEDQESAWRWAVRVAGCMESLNFEEDVLADLEGLPVMH